MQLPYFVAPLVEKGLVIKITLNQITVKYSSTKTQKAPV
jgi:hypothetical protein